MANTQDQNSGGDGTNDADKGNEQGKGTTGGEQFTPITSQEDFDNAIKARIAREKAKVPNDYQDLKAKAEKFDKLEADKLPEIERVTKTANEATARAETAEAKLLRYEVAADKGLPLSAAKRLQGSTKEELEADADELKPLFSEKGSGDERRGPAPDKSQGPNKDHKLSDKERGLAKARERGFIKT